jgi:(p)ppGpp synthase/HD superfamily hydrolase
VIKVKKKKQECQNELLDKAITYATQKHKGQVRKGTTKPYITHPLETMSILNYMQADTNLLIAGVLHDVIEDTDGTYEEIEELFGQDVAELVGEHSEDKSKSWDERKQYAIDELKVAPIRVKMLVLADKVANLRSMCIDFKKCVYELWERFNAPWDKQAWYYSGIQDALSELQSLPETSEIYWEMVARFKDLFVEFYIDEEGETLYQVCADSSIWMLKKEVCEWIPVKDAVEGLTPLPRYRAEFIEDVWNEMRVKNYN